MAAAPQPHLAPVIDLMEALKKSLAEREAVPRKPPVRAVAAAEINKKTRKKSTG